MLIRVFCLDDNHEFYYKARTPYEAMAHHLHYLNISKADSSAKIQITESARTLYIEHDGKTYACLNA